MLLFPAALFTSLEAIFVPRYNVVRIKVNSTELHQCITRLRIGEFEFSSTLGNIRHNSTEASIIKVL